MMIYVPMFAPRQELEARLQQLLPRLAARLAAERRILVEMQQTEGQQCWQPSGPSYSQS